MTTIAIADDHELFRKTLVSFFSDDADICFIISSSSGVDMLNIALTANVTPDVFVLDIRMPFSDGFETALEVKKHFPLSAILILSLFITGLNVSRAVRAGANGIISKICTPEMFKKSIMMAIEKEIFIYVNDLEEIEQAPSEYLNIDLSLNEMRFLSFCGTEFSYKEIAEKMNKSVRTVESYRDQLFAKLHLNSRAGLTRYALASGLFY